MSAANKPPARRVFPPTPPTVVRPGLNLIPHIPNIRMPVAAAAAGAAPRRPFLPTPPMQGRPGLSLGIAIPEISLGDAAAAAAATGSSTGIRRIIDSAKETPTFFMERGADGALITVDSAHPETATWTFPDSEHTKFYDYLMAKQATLESMGVSAGHGAFGKVRRINIGGTDFILKTIRSYYVDSAVNEIRMLEVVDGSPYVLNMIAGIVFSNRAYILSPYVPGMRLDHWLAVHPSKADRLRVYNGLLDGLEYIHSKGIIHRDIKPENIWVPADDSLPPFYLDFGISVPIGTETIYQGTEHYKPAEVYGRGPQMEDLNYYALGTLFKDHPAPNSALNVNLRNRSLKPNNVRGKRFSRRMRGNRRSSRR